MPRLEPGQDDKIDNINRLVALARDVENVETSKESLRCLLSLFNPMVLRLCDKWAAYFEDSDHVVKPWSVLVADAQYWFIWYTLHKYIPDGKATYNKFIKDHVDQRIRYIFEMELNYLSHNIFPDPDKNANISGDDEHEMLDDVVYKYGKLGAHSVSIDDELINDECARDKKELVAIILRTIDDERYFTQRESKIFKLHLIEGRTHDEIGDMLGISRPRVSQIYGKVKKRIKDIMLSESVFWEVY